MHTIKRNDSKSNPVRGEGLAEMKSFFCPEGGRGLVGHDDGRWREGRGEVKIDDF